MSTTRRGLLGGASALATVPAALAAAQPHPDADLLATAALAEAAERRIYEYDHDRLVLTEDEVEDACKRAATFGTCLIGMKATSEEGKIAKARVVWLSMQNLVVNEPGETMESMGEHNDQLAWSLVNDILAGSKGA